MQITETRKTDLKFRILTLIKMIITQKIAFKYRQNTISKN